MSQKSVKAQRKEQEAKQEESKKRIQEFIAEIDKISEKYRVDIIPTIQYKNTGIIPVMTVIDVKEKYEQLTEEAKKKNAEERAKLQTQNLASNGETPKSEVPKIEV